MLKRNANWESCSKNPDQKLGRLGVTGYVHSSWHGVGAGVLSSRRGGPSKLTRLHWILPPTTRDKKRREKCCQQRGLRSRNPGNQIKLLASRTYAAFVSHKGREEPQGLLLPKCLTSSLVWSNVLIQPANRGIYRKALVCESDSFRCFRAFNSRFQVICLLSARTKQFVLILKYNHQSQVPTIY